MVAAPRTMICLIAALAATACGVVLPRAEDDELGSDPSAHDAVTKGATMPGLNGADGDAGVPVTSGPDARVYAVFVTSQVWSSRDIGGLAGADEKCASLANGANAVASLNGKRWAAWLSNDATSALSRLGTTPGPWSRVDGSKVAQDRAQLSNPLLRLFAAIAIDERSEAHGDSVWTGTKSDGSSASNACGGWTGTSGRGMYGQIDLAKPEWTAAGEADCNGESVDDLDIDVKTGGRGGSTTTPRKRLYCFEID